MAERSVTIRLRGDISDFSAKMKKAGIDAEIVGKKGQQSAEAHAASLQKVGDQAGKIGLVAAAGLTAVVATTANFEQAMSNVAATGEDARESLDELRDAAIKAGADTAFSASEAAAGIENLAKAGVSATDILGGGLSGALDLAAAGGIEVADAAEVAATAMTQFGLAGTQVPHIADLLAAAAGKAQGGVSDMAFALKQSGLVADQVGLSIEETTGGLAAFASAGLLGSDAGTSFKTMLGALTPNSDAAAAAMSELGISAYDAQGNFVGLAQFAGNLQAGLKDLTNQQRQAALETIFGSDAVRAASVLYEQGSDGVQSWIDKVNDTGYAAETAKTRLDNLKGDLEQFMGSLETALIGAGDGSQSALREIVQGATGAVNAISGLPGPVLDVTTAVLGLVAVTGGSVFLGTRTIAAVHGFRDGLETIRTSASNAKTSLAEMDKSAVGIRGMAGVVGGAALAFNDLDQSADDATRTIGAFGNIAGGALLGFSAGGPIGAAIGGGIAALTTLIGALNDGDDATRRAAEGAEFYKTALDGVAGSLSDVNREAVANRLEQEGVLELLPELGIGSGDFVAAILGEAEAVAAVTGRIQELRAEHQALIDATQGGDTGGPFSREAIAAGEELLAFTNDGYLPALDKVAEAFEVESGAIKKSTESTERKTAAAEGAAAAAGVDADATKGLGDAHKDAAPKVDALDEALKNLNDTLEGRQNKRDFEQAVDDFADRLEKRKELIDDLAAAEAELGSAATPTERETALANIQRIKEELEDYRLTLKTGEQAGREWQVALEDIATEGLEVASTLQGVAGKRYMDKVREEFRGAARDLDLTKRATRRLMIELGLLSEVVATPEIVIGITGHISNVGSTTNGGRGLLGGITRAEGGPIHGPGTGTSDSIPAWLSNGEHVLTAAEVRAAGGHEEVYRWRKSLRGYATGGEVFASRPAPAMAGVGMGGWDMEQLVATVAKHTRPIYGDIYETPHNYGDFKRERAKDMSMAMSDGVNRR